MLWIVQATARLPSHEKPGLTPPSILTGCCAQILIMPVAVQQVEALAANLGTTVRIASDNVAALRSSAFELVSQNSAAKALAASIMANPTRIDELAEQIFPVAENRLASLDGLLAMCAFARRVTDGRVYLPSRAHLLFRGPDGLYACVNPNCPAREAPAGPTIVGRLYAAPRLRCNCGGRVFELLTHRDCGAAF